ncbi:MAG: ribonuclease III [Endomicrobia bacterium]|nr:ribonuclease III [Endomicrobiia bacterium]
MDQFETIERELKIVFNDKNILKTALIHKSWAVQNKLDVNNERLEFLGDSVLSVVISEFLYKQCKNKNEGELSKLKSILVSKKQLSEWGKEINLGNYIFLSSAEEAAGGRYKDTIIAGAFEAILGAIYLDQGINVVRNFLLEKFLNDVIHNIEYQDYKSLLQEYSQKEFKELPHYEIIKETGPDHNKIFDCVVKINQKILGKGKGKTKKEAQQNAAKEAIENLKIYKINYKD